MKFTVNWLKQYVDVNISSSELADRLTMAGLEVDGVEDIFTDLDGVKVARIVTVSSHPNADRLVVCKVDIGGKESQVVCGAPNARAGLMTAIALPGTTLSSGLAIKKSKIRGQLSEGMLCSEKDLGISEAHAGIMELDWLQESGQDLADALELKDTVIEVDLTPNRPDCTSLIGIGRETAVFCNTTIKHPVSVEELPTLTGEGCRFSVTVEDADCPRYAARLLKNVTIGPSPWWLQKRLLAVDLRPINNVVDITNFVMLEYGQPLHAFDFKKLGGGAIVVRKARQGETMTTLDGVERQLDPQMLMICDAQKPVAVAGVMGGGNSEVDEQTTEVLLESACFDPVSVRRTARNLNLGTDASYRFERGVDPQLAPRAMERAVRLLCELAGAEVEPNGIDFAEGVKNPEAVNLRVQRTNDLLGYDFSAAEISKMLTDIEIGVEQLDSDTLKVTPPSFRVDLEREVDIVEEVARLKGYNEFPHTMPLVPMSASLPDPARSLRKDVAAMMTSLGFNEAINYSFVTPKHFDMLGLDENDSQRQTVRLLNPLGEEQSVMRSMLLPGLLENVRRNVNYQSADIRLFEIGKCFHPVSDAEQPKEQTSLSVVMSGNRLPGAPVLHFGQEKGDFYDIRGVVETLLRELRICSICFDINPASAPKYCEPHTSMQLSTNDVNLGHCGKIGKAVLGNFGIKQDVYYLDIDMDILLSLTRESKKFVPLPKFPSVKWDIAVLVPERIGAGEIVQAIKDLGIDLVENAELFDIYRGETIGEGRKSVAVKVTYRSSECTLDDETVVKEHNKILDMILTRFEGQLREE
ncbi:MAG: phenylalanine--tRNA ligase subunit beta [Desulfobulbaceae bacterium]|nr:phenylalanine--tRNA ligase subunit beta [Desulfobulbaceae bacterium]